VKESFATEAIFPDTDWVEGVCSVIKVG